uniref:CASP-like protein 2U1 n=1 Tax=Adiantum capillus-veneris TaxID=13818 RepID=CSPL2_ADICA|nr:RecName: Full=CASP-like protein 2U1; Short=AcCASPL2U1 [Adiantum capillus-veneris]
MASRKQGAREGLWSMGVRLLTTLLCITSLILLLKAKQTVRRALGLGYIAQTVKYSDTSGFIYLVYINILVAAYGLIVFVSLIPSALGKSCSGKCSRWTIFVLDQVFAYVLLSAVSAATEVLYLADKGMSKTQWEALCPTYGFFCHMVSASVAIGSVAVVLLAVLSVSSAQSLFHNFYTRALYTTKMRHSSLT